VWWTRIYRQPPSELRLCLRVAARPLPSTLPAAIRSTAPSLSHSSTVRPIVSVS